MMADNEHLLTLEKLYKENPEWRDLPIAIYRNDGSYDYIGAGGVIYESEDEEGKILVFAGN